MVVFYIMLARTVSRFFTVLRMNFPMMLIAEDICMELGLSPGNTVLDVDLAPPRRSTVPLFPAHVYCGQTVAHLSHCWTV